MFASGAVGLCNGEKPIWSCTNTCNFPPVPFPTDKGRKEGNHHGADLAKHHYRFNGNSFSALLLLVTTYNRVYRWTLRQKEQDEELKAIRKENTLLTYGVLACLKGMAEQGCNGPVREAIDKIEKSLNLRAHDQ